MGDEIHSGIPEGQPYPYENPVGLFSILWAYPAISLVLMVVNLYFIVHAVKTGRPYYWIWIIFAMPVLGAAAYFIVEMRPTLRRVDWQSLRWRFTSPAARIALLSEAADESPTVKNRSLLARELEMQGQWSLAAEQYRGSLNGVFADDPRLRISLTNALLEANESEQANEVLAQVSSQRDSKLEADRKLALYRCQVATGQCESAIEGLSELASRSSSLAPRFFLAQAISAAGRNEDARQELATIIKKFRRGNALLRKSEQEWYLKAKQMLKNSDTGR